ncbi:acetyl-CoA carboxylase biotin carboxylase subunit [Actinopolyspora biskrensis]|uniref:biotin carboxylase n=1 Tax=Actinopolyspora biskrensis TaxID=1470178 RepID=A0A852YSM6_9ACTN|nr:biotin carboxylase N-terminal domain-containing protein [Actinopolyspora biskrensis]NYH77711.1 acetyl-CoA carboxylase biotin carboxylase subunit [Actinopolyspora biskrensis]
MFRRVLVCDRGEIAVRLVRACRTLGTHSVVAHSTADAGTRATLLADDTFCLGPPDRALSYGSVPNVLYACAHSGADAVHPGYGSLAESPELARACEQTELTFIGPNSEVLALCGDKIAARTAMANADVPTLPGSDHALRDPDDAAAEAERVGYPVLLKAAAGGGGRGIRKVDDRSQLDEAFDEVTATACTAFGDERVYLEKHVSGVRHVEIQLISDRYGHTVHLGERDCSIQRGNRKLIEEAPAPALSERTRSALRNSGLRLAETVGLRNVATVEFLVDRNGTCYCTEVNPRIQVEHPVTEMWTGYDLAVSMISEAAGSALPFAQHELSPSGHAVEARITAESPEDGWRASAGHIEELRLPSGPGVRVDTWLETGTRVSPHYDPLLAKIIAWGTDRLMAVSRLRTALGEFSCSGVQTNVSALEAVLDDSSFREAAHDLDCLPRIESGDNNGL